MIEEGHKKVIPVAQWGFEDGYLEKSTITWDDKKTGMGPTGTAIKTRRPCIFNDILNNPDYQLWRKEAEKRGYRSSIAIPLVYNENIYGALNVYSDSMDVFDKEEAGLLNEVTQDIAFALSAIETEEGRKKAEGLLKESEKKYREVVENINDIIYVLDGEGNFKFINSAIEKSFGYSLDDILNKNFMDFFTPKSSKVSEEIFRRLLPGEDVGEFEIEFIDKDGQIKNLETSLHLVWEGDRVVELHGIGRDITERKRAEEALKDSEEQYRSLVENLNDVIFNLDIKGNFTYISPAIERISKHYNADELIGQSFTNFTHPEETPMLQEIIDQGIVSKKDSYEFRVFDKNGEVRHIRTSARVQLEKGVPIGITGVMTDITDSKRAEEALANADEEWQETFDAVNDLIAIIDSEKNILRINKAMKEAFGDIEIENKKCYELFHGTDKPILLCPGTRSLESGEIEQLEIKEPHLDNRIFDVTSYPISFEEGGVKKMVQVIKDITERKQAEEELRKSEEKYRTILENIDDGYFEVDIAGNYTFFNDSMCRILGYSNDEILGMNNRKYMDKETAKDVYRVFNEVFRTKKARRSLDWELIRKDGNRVFVSTSITPIFDNKKNVVGFRGIANDITEKKRSEEALRESEEKYRLLAETTRDIILLHDMEGRISYVNQAGLDFNGFERSEAIGKSIADFIPADCLPDLIARKKKRVVGDRQTYLYETEFINQTGERIPVEVSSTPFLREGQVSEILVVARDITERKRAEKTLKDSEKRYRNLVENLNDVIFTLDMEGNITYVSPIAERLSGYKPEEFLSQPFIKYIHPDDLSGLMNSLGHTMAGKMEPYEYRFVVKDGTYKHVLSSSQVIFEKDQPVGLVGIIKDITDRKLAEEELRESEAKLAEAQKIARVGSWDINYSTDSTYYWSDEMYRIFNQAPETFTPTYDKILELIHPDDQEAVTNLLIESLNKRQKKYVFGHRIINPDGSICYVKATGNVVYDKKGTPLRISGIVQDITEWKKMEAQLIQTEKLSSLGGILSGVAHELNNPLTAIIGNAQLLARRDISSEIKDKLEVIQKESMRCTKIVGGLLAFAREHKPERRMISVNDVIIESHKLRVYELKVDDVDIELDLQKDIPQTSADPYQLQQVFINLINNAHDALKEKSGGALNIRSYRRDETILMEFEDNGPGIPKENMNMIFDPFFTTKKVGEGTGLGLSIIYGIVNEHGGKIYVESEIDKGTKFTIELPILKEVVEIDEIAIGRPKKLVGTKSVLVVEDEDSLREFISEALLMEGYVVKTASSGEKAVELLKKGEYDLIISDMKMPGMSGQNLYAFVQKEYTGLADKMLFITGDVLGKETQNFLKVSGAKYIEKPFVINELLIALDEVLSDN